MNQEWNPSPSASVPLHTEFRVTSCESGTLLSHGLHEAEVAHVKNSNYSIMKRKHLSARRVQIHNHHTPGLSAEMGNVSYIENGNMKTLQVKTKSYPCSLSSVFDVIHIWMTAVTASSAASKHSSQQALLTVRGQWRRSRCASAKAPVCHLPCRSLLSPSLSLPPPGLSRCCGSEDLHCRILRFKKHHIEPNLACVCVKTV